MKKKNEKKETKKKIKKYGYFHKKKLFNMYIAERE